MPHGPAGWRLVRLPCRFQGIFGSAWAALPGGGGGEGGLRVWCLVPTVPGLHASPRHNAASLLSSRSGLDNLSTFFFSPIFYEIQQILLWRKLPGQWETGICQQTEPV